MRPRIVGTRKPLQTILIVCEGEKTEPNYFKGFKLRSVHVSGSGKNTHTLVEEAIREWNDMEGIDECWCVFDRDSFPAQNFNTAIKSAANAGIHVAYSNEAFELWYILHFDYMQSGLSRTLYSSKLTERLARPYKKNDATMYETLKSMQATAIKNAKKLLENCGSSNPEQDNPSTTVHLLVERLNQVAVG